MSRICAAVFVAAYVLPTAATSFPPVSFNDLVARADMIFVGEVTDVRVFTVPNRDGRAITTRVTFRVGESLLGAGPSETLEFLGGELNGVRLAIAGMPQFKRGDRRLIFARRELSINPIVGFAQGVMRIARDENGVDRVLTIDGAPLTGPEIIGSSIRPTTMLATDAMPLTTLRGRIRATLAEARRR